MITRNEIKKYSSLKQKKFRDEYGLFLVEGKRFVEEGLASEFHCELVFSTDKYFSENEEHFGRMQVTGIRFEIISRKDLEKITDTKNPQGIAAVFHKSEKEFDINKTTELIIALEDISDPGNLGTIIRNCDWFGIKTLLVSSNSADVYNPKVLRSTVGSIFHLDIFQLPDFSEALKKIKSGGFKIILADLNGENLYDYSFPSKCVIVFANEASGPSLQIQSLAENRITIPKTGSAESLNVAGASAIIISELRRKISGN
ncbi:MAG: RNA methyltransferase [Melioribacteraceae bacterium]|nr:RNA methyltransferase [Melioribacteraceae bacterium]MCF8353550.1 RNA methyltransferase [Melioribacteraceae bacterium]MCF8392516.1 RNA methyltransferase [Melioribacteraceae bacterium]MCF8418469.1 RNA methyltransferase [Melioribacteraceae bacterium]